jgi:hypothetical protein
VCAEVVRVCRALWSVVCVFVCDVYSGVCRVCSVYCVVCVFACVFVCLDDSLAECLRR